VTHCAARLCFFCARHGPNFRSRRSIYLASLGTARASPRRNRFADHSCPGEISATCAPSIVAFQTLADSIRLRVRRPPAGRSGFTQPFASAAKIRSGAITSPITEPLPRAEYGLTTEARCFHPVMNAARRWHRPGSSTRRKAGNCAVRFHRRCRSRPKDHYSTPAGSRTTAGSGVFEDRFPTETPRSRGPSLSIAAVRRDRWKNQSS